MKHVSGADLRHMGDFTTADPRRVQEDEYKFPYHYVPDVAGGRVVYALAIDWAADYLSSIDLVRGELAKGDVKSVCDFGCGDGRLINQLAPEFADIKFVGLELSPRALEFAKLFRGAHNAAFRLSTAPGPLEAHDLVTCIEVFEHVPPDEANHFLRLAWERVAPGGKLLLTVPHANVPVHAKHYRHFTGESLSSALREGIGVDIDSLRVDYCGRIEKGLGLLLSKLARNRLLTIEPLFQWRLRRRLRVEYVPEAAASRIIATVRRRA